MQKSHSSNINQKEKKRIIAKYSANEQLIEGQGGSFSADKEENVRVAVRIRPMNQMELTRGDEQCLKVQDKKLRISHKGVHREYEFNYLLDTELNQQNCYQKCKVNEFVQAAVDGYNATIFAYGQTGSGKTYTMAGKEDIFTREVYKLDERQGGIIPRAIQQLWQLIKNKKNQFYIKASFTEIYNEQINDLLNLSSGVLHCRWNPTNGFFVEDLIVVDCSNVDDMISVLLEGIKNRRSGSHQMNKDSSRSHSILTLYIISEEKINENKNSKKYGKISFVDLAGSQRLKQSKSQGDMIKQTGNINKSLFTLGKVIKELTSKKSKIPYIPYRDSKLTMLLMDSLGGNSKALMIACASLSAVYLDQTMSTLNYAARTMNIRNKPVIQMDQKDHIIQQIQTEIQALRRDNVYLREQYQRVNRGLPLKMPQMSSIMQNERSQINGSHILLPLDKSGRTDQGSREKGGTDALIGKYQSKFEDLKFQNDQMREHKQQSEEMYKKMMDTNMIIQNKLDNLEQIFLNKKKKEQPNTNQIVTSSLLVENTQLKKKLRMVQKQKIELELNTKNISNNNDQRIEQKNKELQIEIQNMQIKQKQLLQQLHRK